VGSGGFFGKGWLNGSQAHLKFLPEPENDFIFAVFSEEFGFLGALLLIAVLRAWFTRPEAEAPAWYRSQGDPIVATVSGESTVDGLLDAIEGLFAAGQPFENFSIVRLGSGKR